MSVAGLMGVAGLGQERARDGEGARGAGAEPRVGCSESRAASGAARGVLDGWRHKRLDGRDGLGGGRRQQEGLGVGARVAEAREAHDLVVDERAEEEHAEADDLQPLEALAVAGGGVGGVDAEGEDPDGARAHRVEHDACRRRRVRARVCSRGGRAVSGVAMGARCAAESDFVTETPK